jgi:hypothetical protein
MWQNGQDARVYAEENGGKELVWVMSYRVLFSSNVQH